MSICLTIFTLSNKFGSSKIYTFLYYTLLPNMLFPNITFPRPIILNIFYNASPFLMLHNWLPIHQS